MNFAKFLRTPFLQNTSGRLLLSVETIEMFIIMEIIIHLIKRDQQFSTNIIENILRNSNKIPTSISTQNSNHGNKYM